MNKREEIQRQLNLMITELRNMDNLLDIKYDGKIGYINLNALQINIYRVPDSELPKGLICSYFLLGKKENDNLPIDENPTTYNGYPFAEHGRGVTGINYEVYENDLTRTAKEVKKALLDNICTHIFEEKELLEYSSKTDLIWVNECEGKESKNE